ncbi:MAG: putative manganese-dependent inorganic diphosphatase [Bacilli bacterium]|nr:putative manganese-dependent inorganic diphosphatase [Bacilli bacterium]
MKSKKVLIFGHRNPDTDSVTSAIALSYLKRELGIDAIPAVLSDINQETKFVLNYFNEKEPMFINDIKIKVRDLNYTKRYNVTEEDSINTTYKKMAEAEISKIPVIDNNKKLLGIISMKDIAKDQFSNNIDLLDTTYNNIIDTIDGEEVLKFDEEINGNLSIISYQKEYALEESKFNNNTILMVGDRHNIIEQALNKGIKLLIITGPNKIKEEYLEIAKRNRVNIINTNNSTIITARKINLCNKVKTLPYEKNITVINENDSLTDLIKFATKTRYSYYPVVNNKDECIGILRLSDVVYNNKQKVILVDHNTPEQTAIGIEEAEILEIIDHHNIGSIGTNSPISFRNMPVGSTNTIINLMYQENNIEIPKNIAGLMLAGILSDTLVLASPTTTDIDREAVKKLSSIAEIDYNDFGLKMLKAGSSLKGKTKEEIIFGDFKNYPIGDEKIGLSQLSTTNADEILNSKDEYISLLNNIEEGSNYYFVILFVTDIIKQGSYVIYSKRAENILKKVYNNDELKQGTFLKGIISRKMQIVPGIMLEMESNY